MTTTETNSLNSAPNPTIAKQRGTDRELFNAGSTSKTRIVGLATVITLLVTGTVSFLMLIGFTPIEPSPTMVKNAALVNGVLILVLIFLIGKEVAKIIRSRKRERSASRLHVRIISLFCLVAAFPAILVAIVAGITLDLGLDRWFEIRTKRIIESSVSVARAYRNESTRVLLGNTLSMASNLDRNRRMYTLDREGFKQLFALESRGRGLIAASLINEEGDELLGFKARENSDFPEMPAIAMELAANGEPVPIPPGNTNLIGAVFKMRELPNAYLYTLVAIQPAVIEALRSTQQNSESYNELEENRLPFQIAFALLYFGVCVIVLLCAIWMGISVATRIVTPIRRLMFAANEISTGNLGARVDLNQSEGDLRFLGETFNEMVNDLEEQRGALMTTSELMDQRARFIEAVLSGVSAAVIGIDGDGNITIANRTAENLLGQHHLQEGETLNLRDVLPELASVYENALRSHKQQHLEQITLKRNGRERTLNVQVTSEEDHAASHSYVLTLDDITDLVAAQRNTAWADVARRIAHEIKNPLTPIQLSAERIKRRYGKHIDADDREVFDNCTDTIIRQVGDIGRMVDEFSSFARMPTPIMKRDDLKKIVRETVFMQKVGFPDIEINLDLPDNPIDTVLDERMISQALINVIKNAAEAIEGVEDDRSGRIWVKLKQVDQSAVIDVIDNGKGLPEENRQRLLEPYMTTREKGTGLGLPIVRKIFEDHGGSIELMDAPMASQGQSGTMMRMRLPLLATVDLGKEQEPEDR